MSEFNYNEAFEFMAKQFFEESGFLAPGKDYPAASGYCENDEETRQRLWRDFMGRRNHEAWTLWHKKYGYLQDQD